MPKSGYRERLNSWLERPVAQWTITFLIVVNGVILGIQASDSRAEYFGDGLNVLDQLILAVFVLEIILKLIAQGRDFFRNRWNLFDLLRSGDRLGPRQWTLRRAPGVADSPGIANHLRGAAPEIHCGGIAACHPRYCLYRDTYPEYLLCVRCRCNRPLWRALP